MATFSYKAVDGSGKSVTGTIEATDRKQVVRKLASQQIRPVTISHQEGASQKKQKEKATAKAAEASESVMRKQVTLRFRSNRKVALSFLRKLMELLSSGLPIGDAVRTLSQRLTDPAQKNLATEVWKQLSEGRTFASAIANMPDVFDPSVGHMIEAGEATGNLAPILRRIVDQMEAADELKSRLIAGLSYPLLLCSVAVGVVFFFIFFLLPRVQSILTSLKGEMQWIAELILVSAQFMIRFGPFILAGFIVLLIAFLQWRKTPVGREKSDRWFLKIPVLRTILIHAELFHFSSLTATLIESGINTTETLRLAEKTIKNTDIRGRFSVARQQIQEGVSMSTAFRRMEIMPDLDLDMLTVGENTGNLVNSLHEIAKTHSREMTKSLDIFTKVLTTGALGAAFALVAVIAVSIVMSVFQVSNTLTGR